MSDFHVTVCWIVGFFLNAQVAAHDPTKEALDFEINALQSDHIAGCIKQQYSGIQRDRRQREQLQEFHYSE